MDEFLLPKYRVLDLTNENGYLCGKILADLGADVVKIEPPDGDSGRRIGPFYHDIPDPEKSLYFFAYNSNKRGITLNLKVKDGVEVFKRLLSSADCVIESFPPGYMNSLSLGYEALSEINPRLVLTSITPFGQIGPHRDYKAGDLVIQAMSGMMSATGDPDRAPLRWGGEQSFVMSGIQAATGAMVALHAREASGKGQWVDVSMQDCMCWANTGSWNMSFWPFMKFVPKRAGNRSFRGAVFLTERYPCKDGYINWRIWTGPTGRRTRNLVEFMDSKGKAGDLTDVPWTELDILKLKQDEVDHWEEEFADFFKENTGRELYEKGAEWGFLTFPISGPKGTVESPQLIARNYFSPVEHDELNDTITYPVAWFKSTAVSVGIRHRAPLIGEHNADIYQGELGLSKSDFISLESSGVI